MAAKLLTKEYQWLGDVVTYVASGPSSSGGTWYCTYWATAYGRYISQDIPNNTTTMQFKIVLAGSQSSGAYYITHSGHANFSGGVEGYQDFGGTYYSNTPVTIIESSKAIPHSTDGKLTYEQSCYFHSNLMGTNTVKFEVTVPDIPRAATLSSGTDFNDEGSPVFTFTNPANFIVKPYLKFYDLGNNLVHTIESNDGITSPYTWDLTTSQRNELRTATNKQESYTVVEGLETFNGETSVGTSELSYTYAITNAAPTATHTITETDSKVVSVLGSKASLLIKGVSDIKVTVNPTLKKGATLKSVSMNMGGRSNNGTNPYTFTNNTGTSLSYTVTDSRGLTVSKSVNFTQVDYIPVSIETCEFRRAGVDSNNVILDATIAIYTNKINNKTNTPTITYSSTNGASGTITTYTTGTNSIKISELDLGALVSDGEVAPFTLQVRDLFTDASATNDVILAVPPFDAGMHDFQVNGTLYVADTKGANRVDVLARLNNTKAKADAAPTVFIQSTEPTATKAGDIWFKTE